MQLALAHGRSRPALELEVEGEANRAAGEVTGDVDGGVEAAVAGLDGVPGVGDERDVGPPGADGFYTVVFGALVLDGGVVCELGEVGVGVGPEGELE
jgi:hypothetical protein